MSAMELLRGTPVWVWVLLVFLLRRGLVALGDREMSLERLFLLPLVFLIWGLWGLWAETGHPLEALGAMVGGLIVGGLVGWALWSGTRGLRRKPDSQLIVRPGTPMTLALIVIAFVVKFGLSATLAIHPELFTSANFALLFGASSGLIDGLFWGGTFNLLWRMNAQPAPQNANA